MKIRAFIIGIIVAVLALFAVTLASSGASADSNIQDPQIKAYKV